MAYLLDTNVWIIYLKMPGSPIRARLAAEGAKAVFSCSVVHGELMHGALKYQLVEKRRQVLETLLGPYASLPYDNDAAEKYAEIRHYLELRGEVIGPFDLQIAAIALTHDLTLVTHNTSEFARVPGLRLEDWA